MTKIIEERRLKFIETELGYYIEDPSRRSVDKDGGCYYRHPDDGRPCLIGKQISDSDYADDIEYCGIGGSQVGTKLSKEVQELGEWFLVDLQNFHDTEENWTITGLSVDGVEELNRVKQEYCGIPRDNIQST
jgi:hypothetical protein